MKTPGRGCCIELMSSSQYINSQTEVYISSYKLQPFVFWLIVQRKKKNPVHSCALPSTVSAVSTALLPWVNKLQRWLDNAQTPPPC